jgi:hypothetical protein
VYVDNRFIIKAMGTSTKSIFKNFKNGEAKINFEPIRATAAISIESQFENYATYLIKGIKNLMFDFGLAYDIFKKHADTPAPSTIYSSLSGPKGTVMAVNFGVNGYLKNNSTEPRDFRYNQYGKIDQYVFDSTHKFDYIDTTVYIEGSTSQSRVQVPLRLIRYSGT